MNAKSTVVRSLRRNLGPTWPVRILLLAALVLWPVAVYWRDVAFDAPRFVEEWIKMAVGGIILVLALEMLRRFSDETVRGRRLQTTIAADLLVPLRMIQKSVAACRQATAGDMAHRAKAGADIQGSWSTFCEAARKLASEADSDLPRPLREAIRTLDVPRVTRLLTGLTPGGVLTANPVHAECDELETRIATFLVSSADGYAGEPR